MISIFAIPAIVMWTLIMSAPRAMGAEAAPGAAMRPASECAEAPGLNSDRSRSSADTLSLIRCLLERGHTALAILLLQQLLAVDESNQTAAALLDEQLGKIAKPDVAHAVDMPWGGPVLVSAWLAAEAGHDSNINRATSAKVIDIPLLNYRSLSLPELLVERPSSFAGLSGGVVAGVPITPTLRASFQVQAGLRGHVSELAYAPHNYLAAAQLEQDIGSSSLGIGGSAVQQWLAKYRLLERNAIRLQAATRATETVGLVLSAEWASNTYPQFQGVGTRENSIELRASYRPFNLHVAAYQGEEASRTAIKDLDRSFDGLSVGWRHPISESWRLAIDASSGRSRYKQFSRLFATRRSDRLMELSLALQIRLGTGWSLMPKVMMERADSSVALNGYRRTQYLAELRKDF
jgi:hypothetical protein